MGGSSQSAIARAFFCVRESTAHFKLAQEAYGTAEFSFLFSCDLMAVPALKGCHLGLHASLHQQELLVELTNQ